MRNIKFRGKCLKADDPLENWVVGSLLQYTNEKGEYKTQIVSPNGCYYDVNPETIGQFTGRKDNTVFGNTVTASK